MYRKARVGGADADTLTDSMPTVGRGPRAFALPLSRIHMPLVAAGLSLLPPV